LPYSGIERGLPEKSSALELKQAGLKGTGMKIHCPFCGEKITPGVSQCPLCSMPFDLQTLLLMVSLLRETLSIGFQSEPNLLAL